MDEVKSELQALIVQRLCASKDARMIRDGIARQYKMLPEDFLQEENNSRNNFILVLQFDSRRFNSDEPLSSFALGRATVSNFRSRLYRLLTG